MWLKNRHPTVGTRLLLAATVAAGVAAPAPSRAPQIRLVDNTSVMDAPPTAPGDGSRDDRILTPFDVQDPAIGRLNSGLLAAIQAAAGAAAADGVTVTIASGWRSPEFQQQLLDDAVQSYGSFAAARQYVQTPQASKHVVGEAVDVAGVGADQWLIANGPRFGLCQVYANERWHFELVADAFGACSPLLPNAAG